MIAGTKPITMVQKEFLTISFNDQFVGNDCCAKFFLGNAYWICPDL